MYKFSAPMPYTIDGINKLLDINKKIEKSKITSLYACVPRGCEVFTGFEQSRNFQFDNTNWDYWKNLIEHTLKNNCDFIYLLNSPRPLDIDNPNFPKQLEKLDLLLNELRAIGVKKLRVASAQLMTYIAKHYSDFEILASTSLEYKTIWEYQNFIQFHPEVKQIVPSHDVNKNFKLLSHLCKSYPNVEIELMVNEGCLPGCPNRMLHEYISIDQHKIINNDLCLSGFYATLFCSNEIKKYPITLLCKCRNVFPWDIKEYNKIGINNFKFVGRDGYINNFNFYLCSFNMYLKGIENFKNIEDYPLSFFTHYLHKVDILENITVKEYIKFLPNIEHFKRKGELCAVDCGIKCRYCYKCAEKIQKYYENKQKQLAKRFSIESKPVCVITR